MVSAADKLSNARSIVADFEADRRRGVGEFQDRADGHLWYYRRIADILPSRLPDADRPQRLGATLTSTVHELVEAVGASTAASGRHDAIAEEAAHRAALADG